MPSRKDCFEDIARRTRRPRQEVEDLLEQILDRAESYERDGFTSNRAYERARDEMLREISERGAIARRAQILNTRKEVARHRDYAAAQAEIKKLAPGQAHKAPRLALEAKLVGVNLPFFKGRMSVDAQFVALRRLWVGGFAKDLEDAGLMKVFASRALEDKWTDELFELNKQPSAAWQRAKAAGDAGERDLYELTDKGEGPGNPGKTGDAHALAIAKVAQKWQRVSMGALNREGAWVRSYSGYITKSSHDADAINRAGALKWASDVMPLLDQRRTFGSADRAEVLDTLVRMHPAFARGDHFDYGKPIEEPLYPNVARQASDQRELHFKDAAAWRKYNDAYGVANPTHTVTQAFVIAARRTALMREFGTRPRESYDADKKFLFARLEAESKGVASKLAALAEARESPAADAATQARLDTELEGLRQQGAEATKTFEAYRSWQQALDNRFAQIDGSSMRPVNRALANTVSNWMAIQRMAKLGRVALTHFASLPTKALEARYWGIPFGERFGSLFRGLTEGAEGSDKRAALDATLVAFENRLGHTMSMYDVADAPAGFLAKWETTFFKLTGVSSVIDNQRGDAEAMFASHLGSKRGQAWADIGRKEQRVVSGFGIGEAEWKALHGVDWTTLGDRTYLFPGDAMKLSDAQVLAYMKETKAEGTGIAQAALGRAEPDAAAIAKTREDLAMTLAAAYSDRAGYAIPMPSARTRAQIFGKNYEPGTGLNAAIKLVAQFKIWPWDMVNRAWEREIYGTIGDGRLDRVAGLVEAGVAAVIFGVASEGVRELIQGKNPLPEIQKHPIAWIEKGFLRSGFGSLVGDYLLGEYDRHGLSAVSSLAGPTVSQIDTLMGILHGSGDSFLDTMFSGSEEEKRAHPWRTRATSAIKLAHDNIPFMNLWATSLAVDTLVWNRLQEWINPGYLKRREERLQQQQGTHYWLSPAKTDQWVTGRRASPF